MKKLSKSIIGSFIMVAVIASLTACGGSSAGSITPEDVIQAFEEEGLEVVDAREMTREDFGLASMKSDEAMMFTVPFVCDDCNVRVFSYDNDADLEEMKAYYDDLGKESAILFSHTAKNGNLLIQAGGDMEDEVFAEYEKVFSGL